MFATVGHFHPSLIFVGKAGNITISRKGLPCAKLHPWQVEVNDRGKYSSLVRYGNIYDSNKFSSTDRPHVCLALSQPVGHVKSLVYLISNKQRIFVYDNEYALIIDIYFYEYFHWSQTLSACTPKHFRHPVWHFR